MGNPVASSNPEWLFSIGAEIGEPHVLRDQLEKQAPLVPLAPIIGIAISLAMMLSLTGVTWVRLVVWLAIGMAIDFGYSRHYSKLQPSR